MTEDTIQFVVRGDGRVTGEAFVSFGSPSDSEVRRPTARSVVYAPVDATNNDTYVRAATATTTPTPTAAAT